MPMDNSILNSTKKILGLPAGYTDFDVDIVTHINSAFFTLNTLGVGPAGGFMIEDETSQWEQFMDSSPDLSAVKSYVYLKTRMLFDPPTTAHHIKAMEEQIDEFEYRLKTEREIRAWSQSSSSPSLM